MNALLVSLLLTAAPDAGLTAEDVTVFSSLDAEVQRALKLSMSGGKDKNDSPYAVSAVFDEQDEFTVSASFGSITNRGGGKRYVLSSKVRVGSPKLDNTNFQDFDFDYARGVPAEIAPDALRNALWLKLDRAYKSGLETVSRKRAFLETNQVAVKVDDWGPAPLATVYTPRVSKDFDKDSWAKAVKRASSVFLDFPEVLDSTVLSHSEVMQQWMVSSEGAKHRFGASYFSTSLMASGQCADGMEIRLQKRFTGTDPSDLPSEQQLVDAAKTLATTATKVIKAPQATEDYQGPVLFVDQAAAMLFLQTIGEPLSSPREPLGSRAPGRMLERLGKRVAVRTLTAKDDPTLTTFTRNGVSTPLWGSYPVDDDSVLPKPITLVNQGVLSTYYMSRIPTERIKESNGHCRDTQGGPGTLLIETTATEPRAALKKKLVELAKEEDSEFGLMVELVDTNVPRSGADGLRLSMPVLVWKVFADGREEPVRGFTFKPVSQRLLKEILGMGDDPFVLNLEHRGQKTSVVAPSVLIRLMELTKPQHEFSKPPALPRP